MAELPLLLAGPMLRRAEAAFVAVWVATREPCRVTATLFEGEQVSAGPGDVAGVAPAGEGQATTRRMGDRLHVALVRAQPRQSPGNPGGITSGSFRPGARYSYDITLEPLAGGRHGLLSLGLLADDPKADGDPRKIEHLSPVAPQVVALGRTPGVLPGFTTMPAALEELRIAHASCRKPHGPGTDAMSWLDDVLAGGVGDPLVKTDPPHQLFLTGDQIYADDVATCLIPMVQSLAADLMGAAEQLPTAASAPGDVTPATAPPMRRTVLIRREGGFTSVEAQNHLLTFGEYAAMYLLAWSPLAWRAVGTMDEAVAHAAAAPAHFALTDLDKLVGKDGSADLPGRIRKHLGEEFDEERQRVRVFAATVGKVARVLANVPTLMIFDDHDVTDDWNINAAWEARVLTKPLGVAVMRNALLAYLFFQGWGSDPESFAKPGTPNARLLEAATAYLATTRDRDAARAAELDALLGLTAASRKPDARDERARFHYEAPGGVHKVIVMDSRTRRTFSRGGVEPAELLGNTLEQQVPDAPARNDGEVLIAIASTPVLGPEIMERMIQPLAVRGFDLVRAWKGVTEDRDEQPEAGPDSTLKLAEGRTRGDFFADSESWPSNEAALHALLGRLANHPRVVVLGGDVHYGLSLAMDRWGRKDRSWESARIVQLTSSAARNALLPAAELAYRGWHWLALWMAPGGIEGLGFKGAAKLLGTDSADLSLLQRQRLEAEPSLLRAAGWPASVREDPDKPADWAWRIVMARDIRAEAERGAALKEAAEKITPKVDAAVAIRPGADRARATATAHAAALADRFVPLREAVLTNNVGLVRFEVDDAGKPVAVLHELISTTRLDYPEDEVKDIPAGKPFGWGADLSKGHPHTLFRIGLVVESARPTLPPGSV